MGTRNTIVLPISSDSQFNRGTVEALPNAPGNIVLLPGDGQIQVTWSSVFDVIGYRLYYSTSSFSAIDDPGVTRVTINDELSTDYLLEGLTNGVTYYIRILSVSGAGYGLLSNEYSTTPSNYLNAYSTTFDGGTEYVEFGTAPDFHFSNSDPFTIVAWVKYTSSFGGQQTIVSNQDSTSSYSGIDFHKAGNETLEIEIRHNFGNRIRVASTTKFDTLDKWYHVAATYDGSGVAAGVNIYIDGVQEIPDINNDTLVETIATWATWRIATRSNESNWHLGSLDEIAVYSSELTESQIEEIYNLGIPTNLIYLSSASDLISWWRMGDGDTATTIFDAVGSNDGTLVNMDATNYVEDTP